jgi:SAM-dependent methyltransferase
MNKTDENTNASELKAGDRHYKAYVGPPDRYDFMGATQLRLLCTLGLRSNHTLLDVGCGSLRAGKLFISYLNENRYFGIEPNKWLIEDGIENQVGRDQVRIKKPQFHHNSNFDTGVFSRRFDFILAQSIFSHAGKDLITTALTNFKQSLAPEGIILVTFCEGVEDFEGEGWVYPECVFFRPSTLKRILEEAGFVFTVLPWYSPALTWYLLAHDESRLPNKKMLRHLSGAVLFDPQFIDSWKTHNKFNGLVRNTLRRLLPGPLKTILKKILNKK